MLHSNMQFYFSRIWGMENGDNLSDAKGWGCEVKKNVQEMCPLPSALWSDTYVTDIFI